MWIFAITSSRFNARTWAKYMRTQGTWNTRWCEIFIPFMHRTWRGSRITYRHHQGKFCTDWGKSNKYGNVQALFRRRLSFWINRRSQHQDAETFWRDKPSNSCPQNPFYQTEIAFGRLSRCQSPACDQGQNTCLHWLFDIKTVATLAFWNLSYLGFGCTCMCMRLTRTN